MQNTLSSFLMLQCAVSVLYPPCSVCACASGRDMTQCRPRDDCVLVEGGMGKRVKCTMSAHKMSRMSGAHWVWGSWSCIWIRITVLLPGS